VEFLVDPKIRHKLLNPPTGCLEDCRHGNGVCAGEAAASIPPEPFKFHCFGYEGICTVARGDFEQDKATSLFAAIRRVTNPA
jgi:hypothetical protein